MNILLVMASLEDAPMIHDMQLRSFKPLLQKYEDDETSPANESLTRIEERIQQSFTDYYLIKVDKLAIGAIRIVIKENKTYRVSPVFIVPEYQGQGVAQKVFTRIEEIYSDAVKWELDTILQEKGNCYLYEKLGYQRTGKFTQINSKMTIVDYVKRI